MEPTYDIISPLRVLLSTDTAELFFALESHLEKWKAAEEEGFVESHKPITDVMRDSLGFDDAEQVRDLPHSSLILSQNDARAPCFSDYEDFRYFLHK